MSKLFNPAPLTRSAYPSGTGREFAEKKEVQVKK